MDYKEQQSQEIEALECIYPEEELTILEREYPEISLQIDLQSNQEEDPETDDDFEISLIVDLPETYPDVIPKMRIEGVEDLFTEERIQAVISELEKVAEENLGMVMVFTVVSTLQEQIGVLVEEKKLEAQKKIEEVKEKQEAVTRKKFEGTETTPETFLAWKKKFDAERALLKAKEIAEREAALAGKLTGRQLFLRDATLNLSDVALIQDNTNVEIDESLFDQEMDGLDLDDLESDED